MRKGLLSIALLVSVLGGAFAQSLKSVRGGDVPCPICRASDKIEKSFIPPPASFLLKSTEQKSDFIVEYISFPEEARVALEYAVSIWETIIESDLPIHMRAEWRDDMETGTLASCSPETYYADFKDAPFAGVYYAVAVAEKIAKEELNGTSRFDIEANFSSSINWYFGTDGNAGSSYDFVSVAMHEIAHGLGFTGFFFVNGSLGGYGYWEFGDVTPFDRLVENSSGNNLIDESFFENASAEMKTVLESGRLYSNSPVAKSVNSGIRPRLFSPSSYDPGSSIYHLDDYVYPAGNENSLMTHAFGRGEAIHDPGPLTTGIMEDLGWSNLFLRHNQVKDREQVEPLIFMVDIESHYPIEANSVFVVYSTDNFNETRDTLFLLNAENESYIATLNPDGQEDIQYYLEASDVNGRVRTVPRNAPEDFYNIHFGLDLERPTIETVEIPYYLLTGDSLRVEANVDDNLGIDTVYVTYSINGVDQPSFGMTLDYGTLYSGIFNFDPASLSDGDVIRYRITAVDAANNQNSTVFPIAEGIAVNVEQIFSPVTTYSQNFNDGGTDFVLAEFDIYNADNFADGALHSPHPYFATNQDNKDLNFSTLLKYPIIIQENGEMSFDEVVLVEPGEPLAEYGDADFWDYVILEGSRDFGEHWYTLTDGYDSGDNITWRTEYNDGIPNGEKDSGTLGTAELYVNRSISLLESGNFSVGDTILIRFRLYSDPYARGWGWAIDNLIIQQPLATKETILSPGNINAYPNPFNNNFEIEVNPKAPLKEMRIELYDMYGRSLLVINRQNVTSYRETIDMQKYSSGLFLLKVTEDGQPVLSKKMIKN